MGGTWGHFLPYLFFDLYILFITMINYEQSKDFQFKKEINHV